MAETTKQGVRNLDPPSRNGKRSNDQTTWFRRHYCDWIEIYDDFGNFRELKCWGCGKTKRP